jgi:fatty-acyl-CoA synthase
MAKTAPHLTQLLDDLATRFPERPAANLDQHLLSYAKLLEQSKRVAMGLAELGFGPGDRLGFWLPNRLEYLVAFFACARLGAVCVSINTKFGPAEIGDILHRSEAKGLLLASKTGGRSIAETLAAIESPLLDRMRHIIDAGDGLTQSPLEQATLTPFSSLEQAAPMEACSGAANLPMATFTTSGTTSAPKLVLQSQGSLATHAVDVANSLSLTGKRHGSLQALPLCGVFGLAQALGILAGGAHLVLIDPIDVPGALTMLQEHPIESMFCSDDMIDRLLNATDATPPFKALKEIGFAAFNSALSDITARADARGLQLYGLYGMSECMALFARRDALQASEDRMKGGGRCVSPEATFRVCDPETGEVLPQGEAGSLQIKGPSLMLGYDHNPQATNDAFSEDGWFITCDLAVDEGYGSFEFLGRMGDVLRLGGFLVNPLEIEEHLQQHNSVSAAQVVAIETPRGPRPFAFVVPRSGLVNTNALLEHCQTLAKFKRPIQFEVMENFPVTQSANGTKIQRAKLRDMAQQAFDTLG